MDGAKGDTGDPGPGYAIPVMYLPDPGDPEYKRGELYLTYNNVLAIAVGDAEQVEHSYYNR